MTLSSPGRAEEVGAVVLAAGLSSRTTSFKPLLPVAGITALERVVTALDAADVAQIVAVAGHRAEDVIVAGEKMGVRVVVNPDYPLGMFSSVKAGVASLPERTAGFFVLPVDHCGIGAETLISLRRSWVESGVDVLYPTCHGLRGHPPLVSGRLREVILGFDEPGELREVLRAPSVSWIDVETGDEGVVLDLDTDADLVRLECLLARLDGHVGPDASGPHP